MDSDDLGAGCLAVCELLLGTAYVFGLVLGAIGGGSATEPLIAVFS